MKLYSLLRMLLNDKTICYAKKFDLYDKICFNGLLSKGSYCTNESCNIFGYNYDNLFFTGNKNIQY